MIRKRHTREGQQGNIHNRRHTDTVVAGCWMLDAGCWMLDICLKIAAVCTWYKYLVVQKKPTTDESPSRLK